MSKSIHKDGNKNGINIKRISFFVLILILAFGYVNFLSSRQSGATTPNEQQTMLKDSQQEEQTNAQSREAIAVINNQSIQKNQNNPLNGLSQENNLSQTNQTQASHTSQHKALEDAVIDKVFVDKSEQQLHLMENGVIIKSYHVAMGDNPKGHKERQGDERTPEGIYVLDYKNENSIAHRSIHISYPNEADKARAKKLGVDPGGDIMIHGQMNGYGDLAAINQLRNWTDGCLAVTDDEMDEIMDAVAVGTPIEIVW